MDQWFDFFKIGNNNKNAPHECFSGYPENVFVKYISIQRLDQPNSAGKIISKYIHTPEN